ncbi:hypothetical protein [Georgenia wangjunii]
MRLSVSFRRRRVVTLRPTQWQELAAMTALLDARLSGWERADQAV